MILSAHMLLLVSYAGMASRVSVTKEVIIGLTLGLGAGLTWKVDAETRVKLLSQPVSAELWAREVSIMKLLV